MLKFSYISASDDAVFAAATMHTQKDPLAPIGLLFQGCQGVCIVANIPDDAYQKLVHAIDQAFGIDHKHVGVVDV